MILLAPRGSKFFIYNSVLFEDATPGDEVLKMMKYTESIYKIADDKRIKVVSRAGTKLVHILKKKPLLQNLFNVKIMLTKKVL